MNFITQFIRNWFRNLIVLLALDRLYPGFSIPSLFSTQILSAFVLTSIITFFQPILKMIVLPVNIITFGMFTWLLEALILLMLTLIIDNVSFHPFTYQAFTFLGVNIPGGQLNIILSIFFGSVLFKFLVSLVKYLTTED